MRVYSRAELAEQAELLANHRFCLHPATIADRLLDRLKPPGTVSTIEWSEKTRVIRKADGTKTQWDRSLTPYLVPIMAAHDDPEALEIVVPKPSRCGGTVVAENFALKCLDSGPSWDVMWYLAGPTEVASYADRVLSPLFEDHLADRIGKRSSDNRKTFKRIGSQTLELMVMSGKTTTNRQAGYLVFDEPDSYSKDWRSNWLEQGRQRQRQLGSDRKLYGCAHPDVGWSGGIAAAWLLSTQGIFIFRCPSCGCHGSPYPTKHWADVERFRLNYEKAPEGTGIDRRLALAAKTASIICPQGCVLGEAERASMIDGGSYMHRGQHIDLEAGIMGEVEPNNTWGFWIHVLMAKQVGLSELAREIEGAIEHKERTGKNDKLKQVLVRTFGEVFESEADIKGIDATALRRRTAQIAKAEEGPIDFPMGVVPDGVRFITTSIDIGHRKADVLYRGWDLHGRSWLIDRLTVRQRLHDDGIWRDIDLVNVQDDWHALDATIDRLLPLQNKPGFALRSAVTMIDYGDGNISARATEYVRRMAGRTWRGWPRVRVLKGVGGKRPHLSLKPTWLSVADDGRKIEPEVAMHLAGVDMLKDDLFGNDEGIGFLLIDDGSPGQIYFPADFPQAAYDELFREPKIEGTYVRNGANETIDLLIYAECGRLLLKPDRKDINWKDPEKLPTWARPVRLTETNDGPAPAEAAAKPKKSLIERFDGLNRKP